MIGASMRPDDRAHYDRATWRRAWHTARLLARRARRVLLRMTRERDAARMAYDLFGAGRRVIYYSPGSHDSNSWLDAVGPAAVVASPDLGRRYLYLSDAIDGDTQRSMLAWASSTVAVESVAEGRRAVGIRPRELGAWVLAERLMREQTGRRYRLVEVRP